MDKSYELLGGKKEHQQQKWLVFDNGSYFLVSHFLGWGVGRVRVVCVRGLVGLSWMVGVEGVVGLV